MKIQFDGNQQYQLDAIQAAVEMFDGQPLAQGEYEIRFDADRHVQPRLGDCEAGGPEGLPDSRDEGYEEATAAPQLIPPAKPPVSVATRAVRAPDFR